MYKINIRPFLYILFSFIAIFSAEFSITKYALAVPSIFIFIILMFLYKKNWAIFHLPNDFTIKTILLFLIWCIFSFIINFLYNGANFLAGIISIVFTYTLSTILCFFIGLFITKILKEETIIKCFIFVLLFIIIFGILEFILSFINTDLICSILNITSGRQTSFIYKISSNFPKIQSFFQEPSHYAWFLICNIPIAIKLYFTKYKLFSNIYLNLIIKKILFPLIIISIILTQSPINLIFMVIVLILYKLFMGKMFLKQFIIMFFATSITVLLFYLIFQQIDLSNTYLYRIVLTIESLGDFKLFLSREQSLATRIVSYVNMWIIYTQNSIFGVGAGQLKYAFHNQLQFSPLNLTYELYAALLAPKATGTNPSIFFKVLTETGTVGIILFGMYLHNLNKNIKFLIKFSTSFYREYYKAINYLLIIYCFLMFYDSQITCSYFWLLFGTIYGIFLQKKKEVIYAKNINNSPNL